MEHPEDLIVQNLLKDLQERKGFRQVYDEMTRGVRLEMTREWLRIVREVLAN
jgi:hypothetical protein